MTAELPDPTSAATAAAALDALPQGVLVLDDRLRIVAANPAARAMLGEATADGLTLEEDLHRCLAEGRIAVHEGMTAAQTVSDLCVAIGSFRAQFELHLGDGRAVLGTTTPTAQGGRVVTLTATGRSAGQGALFRDIDGALAGSGIGVLVFDDTLTIRVVNDAWVALSVPVTRGQSAQEHAQDIVAAGILSVPQGRTAAEMVDGLVHQAFTQPVAVEGRLPDGTLVQYRAFPLVQGGVFALCFDVTGLRQVERQARTLLEEMVDSLEEGVGLYDRDLILRTSNAALHRHAHTDHAPLPVGTSLLDHCAYVLELGTIALPAGVSGADFTAMVETAVRQHARGLEGPMSDGRVGELSSFPTHADGHLVTMRDITSRKAAEAAEAALRAERERGFQKEKLSSLGEMLAGIAHELNNPLAVVRGYAQMLADAPHTAEAPERAREISIAAERCVRIVRSFLAMAQQRPVEPTRINLNETLQAAVDSFGGEAMPELRLLLAPDLPDIRADEDQILQVISNLIRNAVQAMAAADTAAPRITIATAATDATVSLTVSDTGPGIPEAVARRIFEPLFTTKAQGEGTGIGLALSHRIVAAHGGRLTLDAADGPGATFRVVLPRTLPEERP